MRCWRSKTAGFFEHGGINWFSLIGSFVTDVRGAGRRRGGSTITMQIARGFFLTPEKNDHPQTDRDADCN